MKKRRNLAYSLLESCQLCPRRCAVNRVKGEIGYCRAGLEVQVSSFNCHSGEEPPISGDTGSGTIFFTHCSLRCAYCQNYPISQLGHGKTVSIGQLADMMLSLQSRGCHNINLVSPTHYVPQILAALEQAASSGLIIPLVYNSSGYELVSTLSLLEDIIDIYMPDVKYGIGSHAERYSGAPDYFDVSRAAVQEMHRQVGVLTISGEGIATRGLLVRHLVLPSDSAGSTSVLAFLKNDISSETYVSLMSQYFPAYKATKMPEMNRKITKQEYEAVLALAEELGLMNGWHQPYSPLQ